jgi:hypothetical protein
MIQLYSQPPCVEMSVQASLGVKRLPVKVKTVEISDRGNNNTWLPSVVVRSMKYVLCPPVGVVCQKHASSKILQAKSRASISSHGLWLYQLLRDSTQWPL